MDAIAEALWSRRPFGTAALLVGAGFSRNAAPARSSARIMPGWDEIYGTMVERLYPAEHARDWRERLLGHKGATSAYLRVAEEFESEFGRDALDKLILRNVPDQHFAPGELHRELFRLPWSDVMTTNWDTLLERASETAEDRVYQIVRTPEEIPEARAPRIIKLHGSLPAHRPFIFTEEDFRTYPIRFAPFVNLAQQIAMENTLVLLGFSGDDPNFLYWSGWVRDRLGPKAPLIYLVGALGLSPSRRRLLERRQVHPIDLALLPEFQTWPDNLRHGNAIAWFLERLRAAEPYVARRWPRPALGFLPPLRLVRAPADPNAALDDPSVGTPGLTVAALRDLVATWRHNRRVHPGWIVTPIETSKLVWARLRPRFNDIVSGLDAMGEIERLDALFELNWQLEAALVPLWLTVDDKVGELLDALLDRYGDLAPDNRARFRALALALVRHAREEGDEPLFARWTAWLEPHVSHDVEARERLTYEMCLHESAVGDVDALERRLARWKVEGDPFWKVRKAGLLADLGRVEEAADLSLAALGEIRLRTVRGGQDLASFSRESFALLFRSSVLFARFEDWLDHQPVRDRSDLRQDELAALGCPGRRDFFGLIEELAQTPPPLRPAVERRSRFDIGAAVVTHHLGDPSPHLLRISAYRAIRFQEEAGLPAGIGTVQLAGQILQKAVRWLIDVAPQRAMDAYLRAASGSRDDAFEALFTRALIARTSPEQADRLLDRLLRLVDAARRRIDARDASARHWNERLALMVDLVSRFVLRVPGRAEDTLALALGIDSDPRQGRRFDLGEPTRRLVRRSLEAMPPNRVPAALVRVMTTPIVPAGAEVVPDAPDLSRAIPADLRPGERDDIWAPAVEAALAAAVRPGERTPAMARLVWMHDAGLLTPQEKERFGAVLWDGSYLVDGLPGSTGYLPGGFIHLPAPAGVDAVLAVKALVLDGGDLTDDHLLDGAFGNIIGRDEIPFTPEELTDLLDRFEHFVIQHEAAPEHRFPLGDRTSELIEECSSVFADLARRSRGVECAPQRVASIATQARFPLDTTPAIPALVALGVLDGRTGAGRMRALLSSDEPDHAELAVKVLREFTRVEDGHADFTTEVWRHLALVIVARRSAALAQVLRHLAIWLHDEPESVPATIDGDLSTGLDLILAETEMTEPTSAGSFDPFAVRYWAGAMAGVLDKLGRGDAVVMKAWREAAETDPLPDTRRAMRLWG